MGYGLYRTVVLFSTGPLLKKLWPLEVDLLTFLRSVVRYGPIIGMFVWKEKKETLEIYYNMKVIEIHDIIEVIEVSLGVIGGNPFTPQLGTFK